MEPVSLRFLKLIVQIKESTTLDNQQNNQQNNQQPKEQDLNQLLKVRREKLANLQEAGKDPFVITKYDVNLH